MKVEVEGKTEFDRFQNLLKAVLAVPHSEIKAKLNAYEKAKQRRKRKKLKPSASGRASSTAR
jgi:hypothetical protein